MASPDPRLVQAIRQHAPGYLQPILLATTLVESGGQLGAVGDGGRSFGPYQEYDMGRGAGVPRSQRTDPVASTLRAVREFETFWRRGARGASLAYRAQRPADQAGYIRKINSALPEAQRILGGGGPGGRVELNAPVQGGGGPQPVGGALSGDSLARIARFTESSRNDVLSGRAPAGFDRLAKSLRFTPGQAPAPPGGGHDHDAAGGGMTVGNIGGLTMGGGPDAHHSRALGNWQSDDAYDLMGKAGQRIFSPVAGKVVKISGQPGGNPGFAGYGITVRTGQGDLFFKHIGATPLKAGSTLRLGQLIGTLDAATAGGPHLHLGGTNRGFLDRIARGYTGRR